MSSPLSLPLSPLLSPYFHGHQACARSIQAEETYFWQRISLCRAYARQERRERSRDGHDERLLNQSSPTQPALLSGPAAPPLGCTHGHTRHTHTHTRAHARGHQRTRRHTGIHRETHAAWLFAFEQTHMARDGLRLKEEGRCDCNTPAPLRRIPPLYPPKPPRDGRGRQASNDPARSGPYVAARGRGGRGGRGRGRRFRKKRQCVWRCAQLQQSFPPPRPLLRLCHPFRPFRPRASHSPAEDGGAQPIPKRRRRAVALGGRKGEEKEGRARRAAFVVACAPFPRLVVSPVRLVAAPSGATAAGDGECRHMRCALPPLPTRQRPEASDVAEEALLCPFWRISARKRAVPPLSPSSPSVTSRSASFFAALCRDTAGRPARPPDVPPAQPSEVRYASSAAHLALGRGRGCMSSGPPSLSPLRRESRSAILF